MTTQSNIKKLEQQLTRLETKAVLQKLRMRKSDTRSKIELGGLVIKSGLHELPKAVILGILLDAKDKLDSGLDKIESNRLLSYFEGLGNIGFNEDAT